MLPLVLDLQLLQIVVVPSRAAATHLLRCIRLDSLGRKILGLILGAGFCRWHALLLG
jgi:hypothetical protein